MNVIKQVLSKLGALVANLGQSIQFVAFIAHAGVACLWIEHMPGNMWAWAAAWVVGGGIKEYVFDARDEHNPPQTFLMNTEDWLGFITGVVLGLHWRLHRGY